MNTYPTSHDDESHLNLITRSAEYYAGEYAKRISGPQLEGLDDSWVKNSLQDDRTIDLEVKAGDDQPVRWPLLVDISHNDDYSKTFFEGNFPNKKIYYMSVPPIDQLQQGVDTSNVAARLDSESVVVYEFKEDGEYGQASDALLRTLGQQGGRKAVDVTPDSQAFGASYGQPTVNHFEIVARNKRPVGDRSNPTTLLQAAHELMGSGDIETMPEHGSTIVSKSDLIANDGQLMDQIWTMYQGQFGELVEDHPSLQIQPREEIEKMLHDDAALNIVYMKDGAPVGMCYFVSNIDTCIWLNGDYFKTRAADDDSLATVYFPGIVVDKDEARQGHQYVTEMLTVVSKVTEKADRGMRITFQSTNVSETYIPKIVAGYVESDPNFVLAHPEGSVDGCTKTAQYNYKVVTFED